MKFQLPQEALQNILEETSLLYLGVGAGGGGVGDSSLVSPIIITSFPCRQKYFISRDSLYTIVASSPLEGASKVIYL